MNQYKNLPPDVLDAIHSNRKIEAIKLLREDKNLGLKEAKHIVDKYIRENPHLISHKNKSSGLSFSSLIFLVAVIVIVYALNSKYGFW